MMEYELSVAFILSKPRVLNRASYILWVLLVSGKIHEKRKKNQRQSYSHCGQLI